MKYIIFVAALAASPALADQSVALHFAGIDMVSVKGMEGGPKGWFRHLGSTLCPAASMTESPGAGCKKPNHLPVTFAAFDPAKNTVVIDRATVVPEADLQTNAAETSPGCMLFPGDADCSTVITKPGHAYGDIPTGDQKRVLMV